MTLVATLPSLTPKPTRYILHLITSYALVLPRKGPAASEKISAVEHCFVTTAPERQCINLTEMSARVAVLA